MGHADFFFKGYFQGKRNAEAELAQSFPEGGVAVRPSFIHGTRQVGSIGIPLGAVGGYPSQLSGDAGAPAGSWTDCHGCWRAEESCLWFIMSVLRCMMDQCRSPRRIQLSGSHCPAPPVQAVKVGQHATVVCCRCAT